MGNRVDYDTGPVGEVGSGWFVLSPDAQFQLHVAGITMQQAKKLKSALEKGYGLVREAQQPALSVVGGSSEFRCREVDDFVDRYESVFRSALEAVLERTPQWPELVAKGDAAANRRRRIRAAAEKSMVAEHGESFRYMPPLLSPDPSHNRAALVEVLCHTYVMAGYATHKTAQRGELRGSIRGWSFRRMPFGCCPGCRAIPETLPAAPWPTIPQHVACGCAVHPILSWRSG